ncbi:MAG: TIGR04150 pseudo-rSAM protein [Bacteroidetes bacterium]|nr:TIGR04150 pseudo-rSAM protein [Bacteroidota bacterium]MCL2303334.1 TIGR04150 pseudo-rSAM protein [Lentimicrobiaceae bacterium]
MSNNYWLFIEPYIHIEKYKNNILLYNTLSGVNLEYQQDSISNLIQQIDNDMNLLVIPLSDNDLLNSEIQQFIMDLKKFYFGDIIPMINGGTKPIQLKPIFNIHRNIQTLQTSEEISIGTSIMLNLTQLTLYINSHCSLHCQYCSSTYKQLYCCTKYSVSKSEMSFNMITSIIESLSGSSVNKINLMGGNVFKHPCFCEILSLINNHNIEIELYAHYKHLLNYTTPNSLPISVLNVIIDNEVDMIALTNVISLINNAQFTIKYHFFVTNDKEYENIINKLPTLDIENYIFHPLFNEHNFDFFKENVFVNKDDICGEKTSITDIYIRQVANPIYFGKLYIMCNGDVFANLNANKIGNLENQSLAEIANNEMDKGTSWRQTRDKVKPCKKCLYKFICPPISNYEYCLGKFDLCTITESHSD